MLLRELRTPYMLRLLEGLGQIEMQGFEKQNSSREGRWKTSSGAG